MKTPAQIHDNIGFCNEAIAIKNKIEKNFLELGSYLYTIRTQKLYEGQWENFAYFLMEMNLTESTASKIISVFEKYVLEYNIPDNEIIEAGGWTKLYTTLPLVSSQEDAKYWIGQSKVLTQKDLSKTIIERKSGVEMAECKHKNTYQVTICKDCGDRFRAYDEVE